MPEGQSFGHKDTKLVFTNSSIILTIQSVSELHRIVRSALADFTAGRELNPASKRFHMDASDDRKRFNYNRRERICQPHKSYKQMLKCYQIETFVLQKKNCYGIMSTVILPVRNFLEARSSVR